MKIVLYRYKPVKHIVQCTRCGTNMPLRGNKKYCSPCSDEIRIKDRKFWRELL